MVCVSVVGCGSCVKVVMYDQRSDVHLFSVTYLQLYSNVVWGVQCTVDSAAQTM